MKGIGVLEYYLGGNVDELQDSRHVNEGIVTALSARTYIESVVEKLEHLCATNFGKHKTPMSDLYHPEMDESPFLDDKHASKKYWALFGSVN